MSEPRPPATDERKDLLKRALVRMQTLESELEGLRSRRAEPLAVVGVGCRFPGGATDPARFLKLLDAGFDATGEIPADRWDVDAYFDPDPDAVGMMYVRRGAFLADPVDGFDPGFFGIAPREADELDPQQRLLLEVVWETLERAGQAPARLRGTAAGVYVGMAAHDWSRMQGGSGDTRGIGTYYGTGVAHSVAAGRIAYLLGLHGPAMTIDTACSSSLVALHLACQALRTGEVDTAIAAGVSLILAPDGHVIASRGRMLSPAGRCSTFDASADGYVRGEGCGVVLLRRLSDARAAGDPVLALVRGTALNQDGRSGGMTAPSGPAQEAVMRAALAASGLRPEDVSYVETHGTGTELGDPIEVQALAALHGSRNPDRPLLIGSVKTNIGHLEGAAGIAGVIKTVLALRADTVPPHLHFTEPNPLIPWDMAPLQVPTEPTPWPSGRRIAGVSSFGFSGTNAHVILESVGEAEAMGAGEAAGSGDGVRRTSEGPLVVPVSARTPEALRRVAGALAERMSGGGRHDLHQMARTLARGRAHWEERGVVVAAEFEGATRALDALAKGLETTEDATLIRGVTNLKRPPKVAFLFTGQGAQRPGMGRELLAAEPVFRDAVDRCEDILAPLLDVSIRGLLEADPADEAAAATLQQTRVTQPALFVLEYALASLWRSWGVEPTVVVGHSVGEYAAACIAGVLDLEDALRLIVQRGRLMDELPGGGSMATVFASEETVRARLGKWSGRLSVAAVNSPAGTVVSGDEDALEELLGELQEEGTGTRRLVVSRAFHSHRMEPAVEAFREVAATVVHRRPRIDVIANRTGALATPSTFNADYWAGHIREPVLFARSVETLRGEGVTVLLEMGPAPVLLGMAAACPGGPEGELHLPSLRPGQDAAATTRHALARAWVAGLPVAWDRLFPGPLEPVDLPTYPFQRERHWFPERRGGTGRPGVEHPLLGRIIETPRLPGCAWETALQEEEPAWVGEHRVFGRPFIPAAALVEMCRAAVADRLGGGFEPAGLRILEPLIVEGERIVQTVLDEEARTLEVVGRDGHGPWTTHLRGTIAPALPAPLAAPLPDSGEAVDVDAYRALLGSRGVSYGPTFRGLVRMERGDGWARGEIDVGVLDPRERRRYGLHPALLDAAFQLCGGCVEEAGDIYLPVEVGRVSRSSTPPNPAAPAPGDPVRARAILQEGTAGAAVLVCDVEIDLPDGTWCVEGLRFQKAAAAGSAVERRVAGWLYNWNWIETGRPAALPGSGHWRLYGAGADAEEMAAALRSRGRTVHVHSLDAAVSDTSGSHSVGPDGSACQGGSMDEVEGTLVIVPTIALPEGGDGVLERVRPGLMALLERARETTPTSTGRLCVLTRGAWAVLSDEPVDPGASAVWGLGQTIAVENPEIGCRRLDISLGASIAPVSGTLVDGLLAETPEDRLALRGGIWLAARLVRAGDSSVGHPARPSPDYALETEQSGELDGLVLRRRKIAPPDPDEVTIRVHATGLNFRDVLNALGMYPGDAGPLGSECVGVVEAVGERVVDLAPGDRVMSITPRGFCSRVNAAAALTVRCPAGLGDGAAATLPIAFLTADWALGELAALQAGERVLIHAAAGGVGLAAVQWAHAVGAEVFATAGSERKRAVLRRMGVRHIYDSRSLDFRDRVLHDTGGEGVHVVLNSLADDFIPASLDVLRADGRFVEIGKTDVWDEDRVREVRPQATYHVLYLGDACERSPDRVRARLLDLVARFEAEVLQPLPFRAFPLDDAAGAFRYMAQARHIGKVVLFDGPEGADDPGNGAVWITGGLGGLGLAAARDLVETGWRRIALTGRRGPSPEVERELEELRARGAEVRVLPGDVAVLADVIGIRDRIAEAGWTLRSVIHAAGVLDDAALPRQSWEGFETVLSPKASGAWNLHVATEGLPIRSFVLYSAGAGLLGSPGQANYAAANSFLDGLAQFRRSRGLPALSVAWGPWADVGMASRSGLDWSSRGLGSIDAEAGGAALRRIIRDDLGTAVVLPIDWSRFPVRDEEGGVRPFFSLVAAPVQAAPPAEGAGTSDWRAMIAGVPAPERAHLIETLITEEVSRVLGLSASRPPARDQGLTDLGMDSLMAVELSNRMGRGLDTRLPSTLVFEHSTVQALGRHLLQQIHLDGGPVAPTLPEEPSPATDPDIDGMSEDDLSSALLDELGQIGF